MRLVDRCAGCAFARYDDWNDCFTCRAVAGRDAVAVEQFAPVPAAQFMESNGCTHAIALACAKDASDVIRCDLPQVDGMYTKKSDTVTLRYYSGATAPRTWVRRNMLSAKHTDGRSAYVLAGDAVWAESAGYITREYADEHFSHCDNCGGLFRDDMLEHYDDGTYCPACADRVNPYLRGWHWHKGSFETVGEAPYTMGWELEIERHDVDVSKRAACEAVAEIAGDAVVFETDSSLDDGIEIISQPHDWASMQAFPLEEMCAELVARGYTSHDSGNCGFHVHVAAEFFGDTEQEQAAAISRLLRWYYRERRRLTALSRRGLSLGYCAWDDPASYDCDTRGAGLAFAKKEEGDRYTVINLNNWRGTRGTIEYRLCRGSLNPRALRAWLELHHAITLAARKGGDALTWGKVVNACSTEARVYIKSKVGEIGR